MGDIGIEGPPFIAEPLEDPFAPEREPAPAPSPEPAEEPTPATREAA